jgi:glycine cleavage system regulatory protein
MMKRFFCLFLLAFTLVACEQHYKMGEAVPAAAGADKTFQESSASSQQSPSARQFLAYEHSLTVDANETQVAGIYRQSLAACLALPNAGCVVLDSRLSTGRETNAAIKMRIRPEFVKKIIESLGKLGDITHQSTTVEDLATPIGDAEKKLAMLTSYRTQLEGLRGKANNDIDAAIKITKELAEVQSDLENLAGEHAHLLKRVQTEVLNINIESAQNLSWWAPIRSSLQQFSGDLAQGLATAITASAFALPWLVVFGLLAWLVRKVWLKLRPKAKVVA